MKLGPPPAGSHDAPSGPPAVPSETNGLAMAASRMDLLSQMLTLIQLRGELVFASDLTAPWAMRFEPGGAYLHVVTAGNIALIVGNERPVLATAGDLLMLPHGSGHALADHPKTAPVAASALFAEQFTTDRLAVRHGGNGPLTQVISGLFRFENHSLPSIVASLPSVIHIRRSGNDTAGWLEGLANFLLMEARTPNPGAALMISRLIDLMVIRSLRSWAMTEETAGSGWLGALADVRISRALKAIHDAPFRRWTVAELAQTAAMSRSSFAERFAVLVGEAPLHYHNRWRLSLAVGLLQQPGSRVNEVAHRVGYASEAAFSRAFKAVLGYSPGDVRRA